MRRILKFVFLFWVARWLGREIAACVEGRGRVVE